MPVYQFEYQRVNNEQQLTDADASLLQEARNIVKSAYAPYSRFYVGAAVRLANGKIVHGVNIENASYPVGLCAERSALASALSQYPGVAVEAIAITTFSNEKPQTEPAYPCGMCRQFITECEDRFQNPIRLILGAEQGDIVVIPQSHYLLPFRFGPSDLL
ncbi:MAG: cytidine deaminase [Chitinophagaceae bacterium]|nr:cytidine deaminase [Chitinophagaceae bacterium]